MLAFAPRPACRVGVKTGVRAAAGGGPEGISALGFVRLINMIEQSFNINMSSAPASAMTVAATGATRSPVAAAQRPRRASPAQRPDRRHAILLAAEKPFAQRGYHAVTIRQIAEEAGVPLALVAYYFGAKHELFAAIFAHWNSTIEARLAALRAVRLDAADSGAVAAIVEAFVLPVLRLRASAEGEYYALLVARQLHQSVDEADEVLRRYFDPMAHAFIDALHAVLPAATRAQVAWCYQFLLGALLHHISDSRVEALSRGANRAADPAAAPLLVRFIEGGVHAALDTRSPAPTPPTRLRRPPR